MGEYILLIAAAFPLMGSPGPATMSLAAIGAAYGARRGLLYLLGIIAGTATVLILVATGVSGLITAQPALVGVITAAATAYILYLAYRIATAPVGSADPSLSASPSVYGGFMLALANPKAFAAIGAVYSGRQLVPSSLLHDAMAKFAVLFAVIVIVNSAWLLFGSAFSGLLRDPKLGRIANIVFALLLVASVALAVFVA
ncbi:LysE family translocator [Nitratireductor sp. XY-223]|uniref:LysE family translocator n=1 Tax=Nitratireductor sp. XY-223 TaxID=2561926 RepID=UPI001FEF1F62|nr:LysE family translocator [Nitratireductor sp. XY-223]